MTKKRVFISFDYDNDRDIKTLFVGQSKLEDSPFDFVDSSVKAHLTGDWEEKVRTMMGNIDIVIFLCGTKTHKAEGVTAELRIAEECGKRYFYIKGRKDETCVFPDGVSSWWNTMHEWTWPNVKKLVA